MFAVGLGVGLALSACSTSGSAAGAGASSAAPSTTSGSSAGAAASSAAPSTTSGQPLALADCQDNPVVKPTTYRLGCFNAINNLTDLHWTTWGQTATATGTEQLNACVPDCAPSQTSSYPVSVQMSGSGVTTGGLHVYTYVTITYPGTMPALQGGEVGGVVTQTLSHSRTILMDTSKI